MADVFITTEVSKLPPEYAAMVDPAQPLGEAVAFYEKRIEYSQMLFAAALGIGLPLVGLLSFIFGIAAVRDQTHTVYSSVDFLPFGFGLTCLIVGWLMIESIRTRWKLMQKQKAGVPTRIGIFLTADSIFEANEFGYCIIPRERFRGLSGSDVKYLLKDQEKSFALPTALVNSDLRTLQSEIVRWASVTPVE